MYEFILKGILRDKSRSLFPLIIVSIGAMLTVFLYSFVKGSIGEMINTTARFETGHVKVTTYGYHRFVDQLPNDLALADADDLMAQLSRNYPALYWTPRIRFGGLLDVPDENGETRAQEAVYGIAANLNENSIEQEILRLSEFLIQGQIPTQPRDVLLTKTMADGLNVSLGDEITLIGTTARGSMAIYNFTITGLLNFGIPQLDRNTMIANIDGIRYALDMDGMSGEILGFKKNLHYDDAQMIALKNEFNEANYKGEDADPFMQSLSEQGAMAGTVQLANAIGGMLIGIFVFAMSIVLWNSGLMNGIRRYGEIGARLAMGESKANLYRSMILEAALIGLIGSVIGTILGVLLSYWFEYNGLDISEQIKNASTLMSGVVRAEVTPTSFYIGFFPGLFASVLGMIFAGIGIYKRQTSELFRELEMQ